MLHDPPDRDVIVKLLNQFFLILENIHLLRETPDPAVRVTAYV